MVVTETEAHRILLEQARIAHASNDRDIETNLAHTINFGLEAMRSAGLINSAAAGATITYAVGGDSADSSLLCAFALFSLGAFCAFAANGFSYFSQGYFTNAHGAQNKIWEHPFVVETEQYAIYRRQGLFWQKMAICTTVISGVALLIGASVIAYGVFF